MLRPYKYRIYPTDEQKVLFCKDFWLLHYAKKHFALFRICLSHGCNGNGTVL